MGIGGLRAAIEREREHRYLTIPQLRERLGEQWPRESANIKREADAAIDAALDIEEVVASAWALIERLPQQTPWVQEAVDLQHALVAYGRRIPTGDGSPAHKAVSP